MIRQKTEKNIFLLMMLCLLVFAVCACDFFDRSPRIKVGILFPMTGMLTEKGVESVWALQMARDEINAAGGIVSLDGAKIELVLRNTKGDPSIGASETEKLITDDNVTALIGTYQSSVTIQATLVAEKHETPFIVSISIADIITERGFRYTFRIQPQARSYSQEQFDFLANFEKEQGKPIKRIALLHENTAFGTSTAFMQKKMMRDRGLVLATEVSYAPEGVTSLDAEVKKVLASNPDAILTVTYLEDAILIFSALSKIHSVIPVIDCAGVTVSPEFLERIGAMAENIFTATEFSKFSEEGKKINARFYKKYGIDLNGDSASAYQSLWVLKDALERAASTDREKLRDAIASTNMKKGPTLIIPTEGIKFNEQGQNVLARLFIVQIQDGQYIPVWPPGRAVGKVRWNK